MMRELDFRRLSMVDMTAALAGGLSALLVALSGHGVWGACCELPGRCERANIRLDLRFPAFFQNPALL